MMWKYILKHTYLHSALSAVFHFWLMSHKVHFSGSQKIRPVQNLRNPSASSKSHSDTSHSQILPQGVKWGNIFNLSLNTIGACKAPQKWIGIAKTAETSAGNTTFYKYKELASAAKFVILSLSLSWWALHSYLYCIIIQKLGNRRE